MIFPLSKSFRLFQSIEVMFVFRFLSRRHETELYCGETIAAFPHRFWNRFNQNWCAHAWLVITKWHNDFCMSHQHQFLYFWERFFSLSFSLPIRHDWISMCLSSIISQTNVFFMLLAASFHSRTNGNDWKRERAKKKSVIFVCRHFACLNWDLIWLKIHQSEESHFAPHANFNRKKPHEKRTAYFELNRCQRHVLVPNGAHVN